MAEVAPAPAAAPAKAAKKKASKPKKAGPSVQELIVKTVAASKERSGVSTAALKKALAAGGYDVDKNKVRVKTAIKSLLTKGTLVHTKGTGAAGSFKMSKRRSRPLCASCCPESWPSTPCLRAPRPSPSTPAPSKKDCRQQTNPTALLRATHMI
uniref:Histone H1 n=1 Tax=Oryzias melastigma TaxID=30732 RepID=A0A3B3DU44_ORYME